MAQLLCIASLIVSFDATICRAVHLDRSQISTGKFLAASHVRAPQALHPSAGLMGSFVAPSAQGQGFAFPLEAW